MIFACIQKISKVRKKSYIFVLHVWALWKKEYLVLNVESTTSNLIEVDPSILYFRDPVAYLMDISNIIDKITSNSKLLEQFLTAFGENTHSFESEVSVFVRFWIFGTELLKGQGFMLSAEDIDSKIIAVLESELVLVTNKII